MKLAVEPFNPAELPKMVTRPLTDWKNPLTNFAESFFSEGGGSAPDQQELSAGDHKGGRVRRTRDSWNGRTLHGLPDARPSPPLQRHGGTLMVNHYA